MCGITAVFGQYKNKETFIKDSLSKIKHRGTSIYEYQIFTEGALGANRLPIVGRDTGFQPLANEDYTIFAAQNGEIFNYKELRAQLEKKKHRFSTDCDTEILVHLYEEYGEKMVEKIDSEMFAFVVYDKKNNNFFVARDRYGVKPLYYAKDEKNNYYFGSELKQLVGFDFIKEVNIFPKGCYMHNGKITAYHKIKHSNKVTDLEYAKTTLTKLLVEAVKKRVDTDLPIAVLLSGGVDSSLVMEIATRFHKDVTGFILGAPGASDYEAAMRLCKDNGYKYQVVYPNVDYAKEFEKLIYHLELYEAQVIRQSFALDILSKEVVRAGYRIALVGEASDELFGGYNEFSRLNDEHINKGCYMITNDLERSHNMRVDRMSMKHTLETRAPFFDTKVAEFALQIDGKLKVRRDNHQITTKYILRKVAEDFLPDYIAWRYKVPFANGAGMNVGFNFRSQDGDVAKEVLAVKKGKLDVSAKSRYGFITEEELVYFNTYKECQFNKLFNNEQRIITKETLSSVDEKAGELKMLVAEFSRMPLYFPIYLAQKLGLYKNHKLSIDFISSGGDDLTYNSLLSGSAQIGIADPVFTFSNSFKTKGKIIGQLIGRAPIVAVALNPNIEINKVEDLNKYIVGTFQDFSTTNTLVKKILPNKELVSIKHSDLSKALKERKIDVGIMTIDYGLDLVERGGHIVYSFDETFGDYLFTGITVCDNLDPKFYPGIKAFIASIKETLNYIKKNQGKSIELFKAEFPELLNHEVLFSGLEKFWHKQLTINSAAVENARQAWHKSYPWLLKASQPQFIKPTMPDEIVRILTSRNISRDMPYREDQMVHVVSQAIAQKKPINLVGLWGASDKKAIDNSDIETIAKLKSINQAVKKIYKPGLAYTILLSDEHAKLNKYQFADYDKYLSEIKKTLAKENFETFNISRLWLKYQLTEAEINKRSRKIPDGTWHDLHNRKELEKSAQNRGFKDFQKDAKRYFVMRQMESELIKKEFENIIFWTYSEDIHQNLYADMPTLYLWPKKRGHTQVPWFQQ